MRFASILVLACGLLGACSSNTVIYRDGVPDGGPLDNEGGVVEPLEGGLGTDAGTDTGTSGSEPNPYGRAYPTANIGWKVRTGSTGAGSVIANLSFDGYKVGSSTLEKITLAQVYDPEGRTHDIVAMIMVNAWDTYSKLTMQRLSATGVPSRVAVMSVLGQGPATGSNAAAADLANWKSLLSGAIHVMDPGFVKLDTLNKLEAEATPRIVILDARTMEIVSAELGAPGDPRVTIEAARDATKARAPAY